MRESAEEDSERAPLQRLHPNTATRVTLSLELKVFNIQTIEPSYQYHSIVNTTDVLVYNNNNSSSMSHKQTSSRKTTAAAMPGETSTVPCASTALFPYNYQAVTSTTLSNDEYCLHLAHDHSWETVAAAVSDGSLVILQRNTLEKLLTLEPHEEMVSGLRFSPTDDKILWTSGRDGFVKMWDVRTGNCEKQLCGKQENSVGDRFVTCMDISSNERILCGGTELMADGAFILFWDVRGDQLLGTYSDSHTDDITQVKFSPKQPDTLATSSTDCLVNMFDISQKAEEDALVYCMNTEVTVDKLFWLNSTSGEERIAMLTDVESLQYWDMKEATPLHHFTRQDIATVMKCKDPSECYLVSVNILGDGSLTLMCGARSPSQNSSDQLCTLKFNSDTGELKPHGSFRPRQKLLTTRTSLYHAGTDTYITGDECGIVRLWKPETVQVGGKQPTNKNVTKKARVRPY
ncbi:hypothetical protein Pcinc_010467 [Petrolisthes cinctipes]|uniref:WD repeat-containing protein 89 n=1 Tax=Petrolisthes cinctipes TaxID=88211 RepID=A0AAE1G5C0_PETCI|nr:hypothetical protein Pcinc_010467 [Petrolisthes cinctipes]